MDLLSQAELAERAGVEEAFVEHLVEQAILEPPERRTDRAFRPSDVYRVRFVQSCERAGILVESVAAAVQGPHSSPHAEAGASIQWSGRSPTRLDPVTPGFSACPGQVQER